MPPIPGYEIRVATQAEVPTILSFIKKLAEYEKLSQEVVASEALLNGKPLFGARRTAEGCNWLLQRRACRLRLVLP